MPVTTHPSARPPGYGPLSPQPRHPRTGHQVLAGIRLHTMSAGTEPGASSASLEPLFCFSFASLLLLLRSFTPRGALAPRLHTRSLCFQQITSTLQKNDHGRYRTRTRPGYGVRLSHRLPSSRLFCSSRGLFGLFCALPTFVFNQLHLHCKKTHLVGYRTQSRQERKHPTCQDTRRGDNVRSRVGNSANSTQISAR
jgi:hypothetical protein